MNVGLGDRLTPGRVFWVYDGVAGIPAAAAGGASQPPKAMIEVVRIGPGFSECRVVLKTPGTTVAQGDLVVEPPSDAGRLPVQPANSGQSPPLPPPAPAGVDTNPGRS